jgi:hypothetical protein
MGGCFNAIQNYREKSGVSFNTSNSQYFNSWIDVFALQDFKCSDRKYTWARGGHNSQMNCLDRYLINPAWVSLHPMSTSYSFPRPCLDHSPICLEFGPNSKFKSNIFRFEKCWVSHDGFSDLLAN